jgi:hypothetical protein
MLVLTLHPMHFTVCFPIGVLLFSCGIGLRAGSGAPSDLVRALKPDSRPDLPRRATAAPVNVFSWHISAMYRVDRGRADQYMREATMRLFACLTMCLMPILANAGQTGARAPSAPQAYCVNRGADFYPYTGEVCKSGYQVGPGNCRKTDGRMIAVPRDQCIAMAGTLELPFEVGRIFQAPKPVK